MSKAKKQQRLVAILYTVAAASWLGVCAVKLPELEGMMAGLTALATIVWVMACSAQWRKYKSMK